MTLTNQVTGTDPQTHFDQIYSRAKVALNNAVVSFDDAKDVTRLMRSEEDSLADFAAGVTKQELAYTNALIELYGTPYTDDIGVGKSYKQDYAGPDLIHFAYVDLPELVFGGSQQPVTVRIDIQQLPADWTGTLYEDFNFVKKADDPAYGSADYIELTLGSHGYYSKPVAWTGRRASPGKIQQGISEFIAAHTAYASALSDAESAKADLDRAIRAFEAKKSQMTTSLGQQQLSDSLNDQITGAQSTYDLLSKDLGTAISSIEVAQDTLIDAIPDDAVFGFSFGGDIFSGVKGALTASFGLARIGLLASDAIKFHLTQGDIRNKQGQLLALAKQMGDAQLSQDLKDSVSELGQMFGDVGGQVGGLVEKCRTLDDADRKVRSLMAEGNRLQAEREIFRQRAAAVIQGFRTRDAAFRIFRNEKLERYKSLFDLASRYAYLAANAYDYETGLLGTDTGSSFLGRIINSRALGVVKNGEPQYAGSNTGDPGLSSALAEMKADWDVLKGRLGFNNPDAYGTTVSLRTEQLRILPGSDGNQTWQDVLQQGRVDDLLADSDVRRYCLQIDPGTGLPVPGIVLTFSTTIAPGQNLFGQPLAAGDSTFNRSTFATKLFAVGVALEGYRGMNNPAANGTIISYANGTSPADPSLSYLDPKALAATPYVYLIPVGVDSMRSPPLGDTSTVRSWSVNDVTIPLPFNIGASDFSTKALYQTSDSLTEPLFGLRKHQAFRPVSSTTAFTPDIYGLGGSLQPSQFTNRRLIGRSVWNSKWKLVIPGDALLNDSKEGLDRFIQTVTDVKLHLITYGYSGN